MSNWKNVNNWHWTGKNCINWAKEYLGKSLAGLEVEKNGVKVTTTTLTDCEGDVDLNQRKGKIITIFDVKLILTWKGNAPDGTEATGTITIPEFAHDTEDDEFVFDISVDAEDAAKQKIRDVVRTQLPPVIKAKLSNFSNDLIEAHGKDVYIERDKLGTPSAPRAASPLPPAAKSGSASAPAASEPAKIINTTTIKMTEEFQTSAAELYEVFLDPARVAVWTRAKPDITKNKGDSFSLFGGNVTGTQVELVEAKKIVQKWRLQSWPKDHYGSLTMDFDQGSTTTKLKVTLTGVPTGEKDVTEHNLSQFYFVPIKRMGYVKNRVLGGVASAALLVLLAVLIRSLL